MRTTGRCKRSFSKYVTNIFQNIPASGIREIMEDCSSLELQGVKDIIHLEVGQPNFNVPHTVMQKTIESLQLGQTTYIPNNGLLELRQEIAKFYSDNNIPTIFDNIVVTAGSMLGLYSLLASTLSIDDECLIPLPGFPNYLQALLMINAKPVTYLCRPENNYLPDVHDIVSRITNKTKCIIICNPGNPTGSSFHRNLVEDVIRLASQRNIFVISDEIYSDITFDHKHICAAELDNVFGGHNVAVLSGFSKAYAMTGYRVGWIRCNNEIAKVLTKIQEPLVSCGVPFAQYGAIYALRECKDDKQLMIKAYHERRDIALNILKNRSRPSKFIPNGAFYLPLNISSSGMNSLNFSKSLLKTKYCAVAPGIAFDTSWNREITSRRTEELNILESFVRVSLANSHDKISEGINRICDYLDELEK